jgi:flavoprotein
MVVINIPVDNETAKIYEKAPQADKKRCKFS